MKNRKQGEKRRKKKRKSRAQCNEECVHWNLDYNRKRESLCLRESDECPSSQYSKEEQNYLLVDVQKIQNYRCTENPVELSSSRCIENPVPAGL